MLTVGVVVVVVAVCVDVALLLLDLMAEKKALCVQKGVVGVVVEVLH